MTRHLILVFALTAVCGAAQSQPVPTEAWHPVPDGRGVQLINIECGPGVFDPREIVVKRNVPVELSVRTSDPSYEFISGFGPSQAVGKRPTVHRFTPTALGRFPLFCQKQGAAPDLGAKASKKGVLTVVPGYAKTQ